MQTERTFSDTVWDQIAKEFGCEVADLFRAPARPEPLPVTSAEGFDGRVPATEAK